MPFDLSLAIKLGRFVADAYTLQPESTPTQFALSDPSYRLETLIYADDVWDDVAGYVPFGFIATSPTPPYTVVISLRGTENLWDWLADANFLRRACPAAGAPAGAETEDGFSNLYLTLRAAPSVGALTLADTVRNVLARFGDGVRQVCICGHSLGGALATLVGADLASTGIVRRPIVYTFASPAVGEKTFATWCSALVPDSYRIFNQPDLVPNVPPSLFGYTHIEEAYQINSGMSTRVSPVCHHSLDTYLHALDGTLPLAAGCAASAPALPATPAGPALVRPEDSRP